jgi:hypothetical protein
VSSPRSLDQQIALVERRLELRRERMDRHLGEVRTGVERATSWWPLAAAVGALGIGFAFWRRETAATPGRSAGLLTTLAAVAGTAVRIALSPQARMLWASVRASGRAR